MRLFLWLLLLCQPPVGPAVQEQQQGVPCQLPVEEDFIKKGLALGENDDQSTCSYGKAIPDTSDTGLFCNVTCAKGFYDTGMPINYHRGYTCTKSKDGGEPPFTNNLPVCKGECLASVSQTVSLCVLCDY
jgi:hypothetical protein